MLIDFIGAAIAFAIGTGVAALSYLLSKKALGKKAGALYALSFVRQAVNVGFIVGIYFLAPHTPFDRWFALIGGALGITLPMFYFTARLVRRDGDDGAQI